MDEIMKYFPNLSRRQVELLALYRDRLLTWNEKINLISRQDIEHVVEHHILHSLAIARCFHFPPGTRILDLGTGGGLPGVPLAIYFPSCKFTLIDSRGKKILAIQSIIRDLGLENVTAVHTRAEDFNEEFDYVVSRAVGNMAELWKWAKKFLIEKTSAQRTKVMKLFQPPFGAGGKEWTRGLIVLKGGDVEREIGKAGQAVRHTQIIPIHEFFDEPYFEEKFIVFVPALPVSPVSPV